MRAIARGSLDTTAPVRRGGRHEARRPGGRRSRRLLVLGAGLLVLAVGAGLALMLPARGPLLEARSEMLAGRDALLGGNAATASAAFGRAGDAFEDARSRLRNPLTRLASWVPLLGRTPDAVGAAAEAGSLVALAGSEVAGATEGLPGGVAALAPRDGAIPIEPLRRLALPLVDALDRVRRAESVLEEAPRALVPGVVTGRLETFTAEVRQARRALVAAEAMARTLPGFLGGDGAKRYFLGAQNPAELRGTGGLIGAFAILTATDGRIEVGPFRDVQRLDGVDPADLEPPSDDYQALYGTSYADISNVNMTPDVPTAATAIERLYEAATGERVDGTILADPHALAFLLGAAGPTEVPATGTAVDAESIVPFVANEAYSLLPDDAARKRILGEVAAGVLAHYLGTGAAQDPAGAGRAVVEAAAGGHLLLHSADPGIQSGLEDAGVAGALADPAGDYLAVVVNNAGANKVDFYADRRIRYDVRLLEDGAASGRLEVEFANDAPTEGQPAYVIGPHPFVDLNPGDSQMIVQTYCAGRCRVDGLALDGEPQGIPPGTELGHPVVVSGLRLPGGATGRLTYEWTTGGAWWEEDGLVVYRLTVRGQPTIRPTELEVSVEIPENAEVEWTTPGMRIEGGRVSWGGEAGDLTTFEVAFARPFPAGVLGSGR